MRPAKQSAQDLITKLLHEAEEVRKKSKRSNFTGIHKYLDLVKDKTSFACLVVDANGPDEQVISFPPITNRYR
jgi:hypothetical protein